MTYLAEKNRRSEGIVVSLSDITEGTIITPIHGPQENLNFLSFEIAF